MLEWWQIHQKRFKIATKNAKQVHKKYPTGKITLKSQDAPVVFEIGAKTTLVCNSRKKKGVFRPQMVASNPFAEGSFGSK